MIKYITSRLMIIFLIKFFVGWAFNTHEQLIQFFGLSPYDDSFLKDIHWIISGIVICLGVISINLIFSIPRLVEEYSLSGLIQGIVNKGIWNSAKEFFSNFWGIFNENFGYQERLERYPKIFLLIAITSLSFIKGNPLINNYIGLYKEYETVYAGQSGDRSETIEVKKYLIPKNEKNRISFNTTFLKEENDQEEDSFEVKKRGYLFLQAGLIDGFQTEDHYYKGFIPYVECLTFSVLEKLIHSIMYFLIPFVLAIVSYHYMIKE